MSTAVKAAAAPSQQQQQQQFLVNNKTVPKAAKLVPFLRKVQILCETAPPSVARWSADGKQFDVLDPAGFDQLLKVHFEGAAPATFHRQLFFYGWVKLNHSNGGGDERTKGTWSFRHPSFLRDEPSRIYEIKRYARASDREEQEDGSRVDVLERRVSALQSLVDDLSRKLAAVQMSLDRAPLQAEAEPAKPASRKRLKDIDEDFLAEDLRLSEDELMSLFDLDELAVAAAPPSPPPAKEVAAPKPQQKIQSEAQAKEFLTSIMAMPQFQAALSSMQQEASAAAAQKQGGAESAIPHLRVC